MNQLIHQVGTNQMASLPGTNQMASLLGDESIPICAMWSNDLMKKMVHAKLQDYGDFGLVDVRDKIFFLHFLLFSYLKNYFKKNYIFFLLL